jgi:hypothetical protein
LFQCQHFHTLSRDSIHILGGDVLLRIYGQAIYVLEASRDLDIVLFRAEYPANLANDGVHQLASFVIAGGL